MEEESLLDDIKEYSFKELEQLETMTHQVLEHWNSMMRPDLKEGTKKAIELSIEIAKNDLKLISEQKKIKIAHKAKLSNKSPDSE